MMRSAVLALLVVLQLVLPLPVTAQPPNLSEFLPDAASIGNGVVMTDEGARTLEDIASTFADPADARERLTDWGWQEQAFRYFGAADPDAPLTSLEVSLHRFSSFQNATGAFPYFLDSRAAVLGIEETPVVINRARAQAIAGAVAEGQEATIYVLLDTVLARVTAISFTDDPLPYAKAVAQLVVDQLLPPAAERPNTRSTSDSTLVERLMRTPISPELLSYSGEIEAPEFEEPTERGESLGLLGTVTTWTGHGPLWSESTVHVSVVTYLVFAKPEQAQADFYEFRDQYRTWGYAELDLSGPDLGPWASLMYDSSAAWCRVAVDNVVVHVSLMGGSEIWPSESLQAATIGNCEGATEHLLTLMN